VLNRHDSERWAPVGDDPVGEPCTIPAWTATALADFAGGSAGAARHSDTPGADEPPCRMRPRYQAGPCCLGLDSVVDSVQWQ